VAKRRITCHTPPHFSTFGGLGTYHNIGIAPSKRRKEVDVGRAKVSNQPADWAAFKVPTLRVARRADHDGSVASSGAVRVMAGGGYEQNLAADGRPQAHDGEVKQLVAFLAALDCNEKLVEPSLP
jgi:cytochrome c peroxidase